MWFPYAHHLLVSLSSINWKQLLLSNLSILTFLLSILFFFSFFSFFSVFPWLNFSLFSSICEKSVRRYFVHAYQLLNKRNIFNSELIVITVHDRYCISFSASAGCLRKKTWCISSMALDTSWQLLLWPSEQHLNLKRVQLGRCWLWWAQSSPLCLIHIGILL